MPIVPPSAIRSLDEERRRAGAVQDAGATSHIPAPDLIRLFAICLFTFAFSLPLPAAPPAAIAKLPAAEQRAVLLHRDGLKPGVIEPLLRQFPQRRFLLVGDSGERDPEIYGALARQFPQQVHRILIRDVTREDAKTARYEAAFRDVPPEKWRVFREPTEIRDAVK